MALLLVLVPVGGAVLGWTFLHSVFAVGVQFLAVSSSGSHLRQRGSKQTFSFKKKPWVLNVARVSAPSPGTLLAQLARLVRITKAARPAATLCVVGVRALLQDFLI